MLILLPGRQKRPIRIETDRIELSEKVVKPLIFLISIADSLLYRAASCPVNEGFIGRE